MPATDFTGVASALEAVREFPAPILVVTHEWPDGDAVGTACGLCTLLRDNGFRAEFFLAAQMPDCYRSFLPFPSAEFTAEEINTKYSMVLNVDASTVKRMQLGPADFASVTVPVVTFDHHPDDEMFGDLTCLDPEASSTAELVARFARSQGWKISPESATLLMLGVMTDTGCFRFTNTTAEAHRVAAELLALGADQDRIVNEVYLSKPLNMVRFESELFSNIQTAYDGRFAWISVPRELLDKYDVNLRNTEQLIELVRGIRGVVVAALIKPTSNPGIFRVSMRSKDADISVGRIARALKGGGHEMAAGCSIFAKNQAEASEVLLRYVRKEMNHEI